MVSLYIVFAYTFVIKALFTLVRPELKGLCDNVNRPYSKTSLIRAHCVCVGVLKLGWWRLAGGAMWFLKLSSSRIKGNECDDLYKRRREMCPCSP